MLENNTPFESERTWVRDKDGVHHWIVVVKATYDVDDYGNLTLAEDPIVPLHAPVFHGDDGLSSLKYEADMSAMKPSTDIYLNAVAYAPGFKPTNKVRVGLSINNWKKELLVYGDRFWEQNVTGLMSTTGADRFIQMPITYERAFGGIDADNPNPRFQTMDSKNPVGTGVYSKHKNIVGTLAPNIESSSEGMKSKYPPGFGAIASYWSPRKELLGTYDKNWVETRKPLLPLDYQPSSLMCAPRDQQSPGYLKGGSVLQLTNLSENGYLSITIPNVALSFDTYFGSKRISHNSQLVSILYNSLEKNLILVWQTNLCCSIDCDYLDKTVIDYKGKLF